MDSALRQRLVELTADFYRRNAESFNVTRQAAWDSWPQILELLPHVGDLLDIGCGNGRFADVASRTSLTYRGVDPEYALIDLASARHPSLRFDVSDIEGVLEERLTYDAIVCFGVLHHLPGRAHRLDVVRRLSSLLDPGGVLAISLWQPRLLGNIESKTADIVVDGLEADDLLLGWQGDTTSHIRYCHHFDDEEIAELIAGSGLMLIRRFQGAGNDRTNHYVVLQRQ